MADQGPGVSLPPLLFVPTAIAQPAFRMGVLDPQGYAEGFADGVASVIPDSIAPTYTIISPTPGVPPGEPGGFPSNREEAARTPIVLRVHDATPGLAYLVIVVQFFGSQGELDADMNGVEETVYRRGAFRGKHVKSSTSAMDGEDLVLTIYRERGWLGRFIKFDIDPIDGAGNVGG